MSRERYEKDRAEDQKRYDRERAEEAAHLAQVVVRPLNRIADRMDAQAITQARHEEANLGIKAALSDMRDEIRGLRETA